MKRAFTMLELIFVLVVIGILAAVIIPSTRTNPVAEASIDLLSKIRYTQHLALVDDKYNDTNATWVLNRWQIDFTTANQYTIQSNNGTLFAKDPQTGANLQNIDMNTKYGVTLSFTNCGANNILSFDHLGRPLVDTLTTLYGELMPSNNQCVINIAANGQDADITISAETGYAKLVYNF